MNAFIAWFMATIGKYISAQLSVLLVSMLPLIELRGGIIVARLLNLPMWEAIFYCVLGNILPIPFILFFIISMKKIKKIYQKILMKFLVRKK